MNQLPKEVASLIEAAKNLLDACFAADEAEELDARIDGSLLDAVSNALDTLAAPSAAQVNAAAPGTRGVEAKAVEASEPAAATPAPEPVAPHLPAYGSIPWQSLYDAISDAQTGTKGLWKPEHADLYPGHNMVSMNLNSLNRIVTGYLQAAQPPAPEAREALRYRWLRDNCVDTEPFSEGDAYAVTSVHFEFAVGEELDAAIDAALSKGDAK